MWAISVFLSLWYNISIVLFQVVRYIFHRFLLFACFFVFLSCFMVLFYFHFIVLFFSDLQDKNFPTLHLWLVLLLFFVCVRRYLHFWSFHCSFSFLFHPVIKNSPRSDMLLFRSAISEKYGIIPTSAFSWLTDYQGRSN